MKRVVLLTLVLLTASYAATARPYRGHHDGHHYVARVTHHTGHHDVERTTHHASGAAESDTHPAITCEMVRAYVAQVGLAQAAAMAESAGITSSDKERARRCLAQKS